MKLEFELILDKSRQLDLMQLIPEKFRNSQLLIDLIDVLSYTVGGWLEKIRDLRLLQDPDTVGFPNLYHLASLLGIEFPEVLDDTFEDQLRKEVRGATDWIKMKGTYRALDIIAYLMNVTVNVSDLYTNDYVNFLPVDYWFVGNEGENPTGFDSTYYKSPHFGFSILLNVFNSATSADPDHLWIFGNFTSLHKYIDRIRPVNTVPHYELTLDLPIGGPEEGAVVPWPSWLDSWIYSIDKGGQPVFLEGGTVVRRLLDWVEMPILRFDEMDLDEGRDAKFDGLDLHSNPWQFDKAYTSILNDITGWGIGTGNDVYAETEEEAWDARNRILTPIMYGLPVVSFTLEAEVLKRERSGSVIYTSGVPDRYTWRNASGVDIMYCYTYEEYWEFQLIIPQATSLEGISEGAIYIGDDVFIGWLHPNVDKEGSGQIDWYEFPGVGFVIKVRLYI